MLGSAAFVNPAAAGVPSIQQNISGNVLNGGSSTALNPLTSYLNSNGSVGAISLNEVCSVQGFGLAVFLANKGWSYHADTFTQVRTSNICGSATPVDYGAWVFTAASGYTKSTIKAAYPAAHQWSPTGEVRGYVCNAGGLGTPKFYFCSTHLQPDINGAGTQWKQWQAADYYSAVSSIRSYGWKVSFAGDMYLRWADWATLIPNFFASNREAGRCLTPFEELWTKHYSTGNRRIDHVFGPISTACNSNGSVVPSGVATVPTPNYNSDHRGVLSNIALF
jgi:hypothetical protein